MGTHRTYPVFNRTNRRHLHAERVRGRIGVLRQASEIWYEDLDANRCHLASNYKSMAEVHERISEYGRALLFYKKELALREATEPGNHFEVAEACSRSQSMVTVVVL